MRPGQTPSVFVTFRLAPGQFDLFEELAAEAIEVLNTRPPFADCTVQGDRTLIILDCVHMRFAMNWSERSGADVITISIGAKPKHTLPDAEARLAADVLREILALAEALFDADRPVWQLTSLQMTAETIIKHSQQIGPVEGTLCATQKAGSPFMTIDTQPSVEAAKRTDLEQQAQMPDNPDLATPEQSNWAMQTSALALSTTVMLVAPPVGVAMLAYTALRQGTEMNLLPRKLGPALQDRPSDVAPPVLKNGSHA